MSDALNPYAPPQAQSNTVNLVVDIFDVRALGEALDALDTHADDPWNRRSDRWMAGELWTIGSMRLGALMGIQLLMVFVLLCVIAPGLPQVYAAGGMLLLLGLAALVARVSWHSDRRLPLRRSATTPLRAMQGWLEAWRRGDHDYVRAAICPSARDQVLGNRSLRIESQIPIQLYPGPLPRMAVVFLGRAATGAALAKVLLLGSDGLWYSYRADYIDVLPATWTPPPPAG